MLKIKIKRFFTWLNYMLKPMCDFCGTHSNKVGTVELLTEGGIMACPKCAKIHYPQEPTTAEVRHLETQKALKEMKAKIDSLIDASKDNSTTDNLLETAKEVKSTEK